MGRQLWRRWPSSPRFLSGPGHDVNREFRSPPSGGIMPDHVGNRGAVRLDPDASRSPAYQPVEHARTSVAEHGDRCSPRLAGGSRRRRSSTPGRSSWTRSHLPPESVFPRARHGRSLPPRRPYIPDTSAAPGPEPGTWKDPDTRRRSSRGAGSSESDCLPGEGGYATHTACPVATTSWRYGLRRTCRLVTGRPHRPRSPWPNQARLPLLAVTHRYSRHIVFGADNFRSPILCP